MLSIREWKLRIKRRRKEGNAETFTVVYERFVF